MDPTARCTAVENYKNACLKVGVTVSPNILGCGDATPSVTQRPPSVRPSVVTSEADLPTTQPDPSISPDDKTDGPLFPTTILPPSVEPTGTASVPVAPTTPYTRCSSDPDFKRRVFGFCTNLMHSPVQNAECSRVFISSIFLFHHFTFGMIKMNSFSTSIVSVFIVRNMRVCKNT